MDIITENATKGIGPNAMAEVIRKNHFRTWQKKEIKWIGFLKKRKNHPSVGDNLDLSKVTKCPCYCSDEIGGRLPSGNWLVSMFCTVVSRLRKYLDGECIARLMNSKIVALDASYKVPKWIMVWGGVNLFKELESGVNEYGETIIQHFEHSDNHHQLETILTTFVHYGLNPDFVFSDVPDRDAPYPLVLLLIYQEEPSYFHLMSQASFFEAPS